MFPNLIAKAHNITGTGWGVDLTVPFKMFPPEYQQSKIWRANFIDMIIQKVEISMS